MASKYTSVLIALIVALVVIAIYWMYVKGYFARTEHFRGAYGRTPAMTQCWIGGTDSPFFNACRWV
jgi:hypothetical protein